MACLPWVHPAALAHTGALSPSAAVSAPRPRGHGPSQVALRALQRCYILQTSQADAVFGTVAKAVW